MSNKQNDNWLETQAEMKEEQLGRPLSPGELGELLTELNQEPEIEEEEEDDVPTPDYPVGQMVEPYDIWRDNQD